MKIEVLLIAESKNSTLSQIRVDGQFIGFGVEDGYRQPKVYGETRIPDGTYNLLPRKEGKFYDQYRQQYKHKFVPHVTDVPGFEYILIHMGNTVLDTHGCLLVGYAASWDMNGDFKIVGGSSGPCYKYLYSLLAPEFAANRPVTITYRRDVLPVAAGPVSA